jgi:hypothetical protein
VFVSRVVAAQPAEDRIAAGLGAEKAHHLVLENADGGQRAVVAFNHAAVMNAQALGQRLGRRRRRLDRKARRENIYPD